MTDVIPHTPDAPRTDEEASDRRAVLRRLALGGAGAAVGALAVGRAAEAGDSGGGSQAERAIELGETPTNTTESPTYVEYTGTDPLDTASLLSVGEDRPSDADGNEVFPAAVGGYGKGNVPSGVHGSTLNPAGFGVVAANLAPAPADNSTPANKALAVSSTGAHLLLLAGAQTGPAPGSHVAGELYVDQDGTLWFTVPAPTQADPDAVRFVKLAGTPTAGSLHFMPFPARVIDTREGSPPVKPAKGSTTTVDLTTLLDGSPSGFPQGAPGALLTVTVTNTEIRGFFRAFAKGEPFPAGTPFSSGNWVGDDLSVAASVATRVDPDGLIDVELGGFGRADIVVDVVGYYM